MMQHLPRERGGSASRFLLPYFLLLILLALSGTPRVAAQEEVILAGTAPAPIAGAGSVVFISQAVDARLSRAEDGNYVVSNESSLRLHNTSRNSAVSVTLGWPGWPGDNLQFDPEQLPGFAPLLGEQRIGTQLQSRPTEWGGEARESNWLVSQVTIGRDTRERISINWRQTLGSGPLLTYSFGLRPARGWPGSVGSARINLQLPEFASEEIVVRAEPAGYTFSGTQIEWLIVDEEPAVNPTVTFIAPHIWREIEAARAAIATDPLNGNLRLSELYEQLAAAGAPAYAAEAEAALEAARRAAPESPEPLRRLARFYRARSEQQGGDLAILEQAVTVAEAALAAGADDAADRSALAADLESLARAWADQNPDVALDFLARAARVAGEEGSSASRRELVERLAVQALERGDSQRALEIARQHGLPTEIAPLPWLATATVEIENSPGTRTVRLHATGDEAVLADKLGNLAARAAASGFPAEWDGATLTIELQGNEEDWVRSGRTVASTLVDEPEWDLLRGALTPELILYRTLDENLQTRYGYREILKIEPRAGGLVEQLRNEAQQNESLWERTLMQVAAEQWEKLHASHDVRVTTRFDLSSQSLQREWSVSLPAKQTLEWQGVAERRDRWLLLGAGGAVALLLLLAIIWLPRTRRSQDGG